MKDESKTGARMREIEMVSVVKPNIWTVSIFKKFIIIIIY